MSQKQRQKLGSAIASTILSLAALSLAGVDKAQAAVLTYNFQVEEGGGSGFFKLSNSSLTGIGREELAVGEGRFNTFASASKNYYDLAGAIALFFQGDFRGLQTGDYEREIREIDLPDVPGGPFYVKYDSRASWSIVSNGASSLDMWPSYFSGYRETLISNRERHLAIDGRTIINDAKVSYTLVDTAPEPVPEPLTVGGTTLALAGLSWLKHKQKMAA
ncbi:MULTISPECIES: PEP-CTERM sorting domain-containing protein [unclassified Microcoleus]|uniref:PEP-CTERM sorting domain-containing protein n=1 Tax=unclassified Microcoleus TaxID=2642155 RepID=UPI002FD281AE